MKQYRVKELAELAGVSVRTLHFYDEKGLLTPALVGANKYRYYDEDSLLRLQQILLYREMDLDLKRIKQIMDDAKFDELSALQSHRRELKAKIERLQQLIKTVDDTLAHSIGDLEMSEEKIFSGFEKEHKEKYEQQAIDQWGDEAKDSIKQWNSYSDVRKKEIKAEGEEIYADIAAKMELGADSVEVQELLGQWHQHLRNFYEPSLERLAGLGQMYVDAPDFHEKFSRLDAKLPAFLNEAIAIYVNNLRDS